MPQHSRHICFKALVAFILTVAFVALWFSSSRAIPTSLSKLSDVRPASDNTSIFHRINLREAAAREDFGGPASDDPSHTEKARFRREDETDGDKTDVKDDKTDNGANDDDSSAKDDTDSTIKDDVDVDSDTDSKDDDVKLAKAPIIKVEKFKINFSKLKGKLNGEEVTLVGKEYEPRLDYGSEIWTRYIVAKTSNKERIGLLRVVDLYAALKLDQKVSTEVQKEGHLARKMGQKMYMWSGRVALKNNKPGYAVMYRYLRGSNFQLLPEWAAEEDWDEDKMLPLCKKGMMESQKRMADSKHHLVIDKISLFSWVTDKGCEKWYPLEAPPRFTYYTPTLGKETILGAQMLPESKKKLTDSEKEKQWDEYLYGPEGVELKVNKAFTGEKLRKAKKKLKGKSKFDSAFGSSR